jgi:hypothetical protein
MRQDTGGEGTPSVGQHIIPMSHNHASATMLSVGNPPRRTEAGSCAHVWRCRAQRDGRPRGPPPQRRASNSQGARPVVRPLQGDLARRPAGSPLQQHDIPGARPLRPYTTRLGPLSQANAARWRTNPPVPHRVVAPPRRLAGPRSWIKQVSGRPARR